MSESRNLNMYRAKTAGIVFGFQDANGIIPHLHGSTDPAATFQRQIEAHGFQVLACEASYGEYDFGNDANSLVAELRAMGGPLSGSFIRCTTRVP